MHVKTCYRLFFTNAAGPPIALGGALSITISHVFVRGVVGPASRLQRQALEHGAQVDVSEALDHQVSFR